MNLLFVITSILTRSIILNPEHGSIDAPVEVIYDNSVPKGTGVGVFSEDKKIALQDEKDINAFINICKKIANVPEDMGKVCKTIENSKTDEMEQLKKGERFFIVYFVDDETMLIPGKHQDDGIKIFISTDKKLAEEMNTPFPGVYGFNARDKVAYQRPLTDKTPNEISNTVKLDLVGIINYQNMKLYKETGLEVVYCFVREDEIVKFVENIYEKARKCKDITKFAIVPYNNDKIQLSTFGLTEEDLPGMLFIKDGDKFPLKNSDSADIYQFLMDVQEKKIEPFYISEEEPKNNEQLPVRVVTRNNLDKFMKDESKDRLLVFSSPTCGHCEKLKPIIDALALVVQQNHSDKLIIGNCNVLNNDISTFEITGVPKIYLIKGRTNEIIEFNDKRTMESLINFIKTSGEFKVEIIAEAPAMEEKASINEENFDDKTVEDKDL